MSIRWMMVGLFCLGWGVVLGCAPVSIYDQTPVVEITPEGETVRGTGVGACTDLEACKREGKFCEGDSRGPADVVVDKDGNVVSVVCYPDPPPGGEGSVTGDGSIDVNQNNGVVTFVPATNGGTVKGDIALRGNNNVLYGNGAGNTRLEGDVSYEGNNGRLRGVTIAGSVSMKGNNHVMIGAVIEGNLLLEGNNHLLANLLVLGNLTLKGNNATLLRVQVAGDFLLEGDGFTCEDNVRVSDDNSDGVIQDTEIGDALSCP